MIVSLSRSTLLFAVCLAVYAQEYMTTTQAIQGLLQVQWMERYNDDNSHHGAILQSLRVLLAPGQDVL